MFIMITAYRKDLDAISNAENLAAFKVTLDDLANDNDSLQPIQCISSYQGHQEPSFQTWLDLGEALELARDYCQESILVVENGLGRLVYLDGSPDKPLGLWRSVSREEALKRDAWTYDERHDIYYICE